MRDTTLCEHLLGIEDPWTVNKVELDIEKQRVEVWFQHPKRVKWPCPECGAEGMLHDHAAESVWRYRDSCQFQTFLHADPRRVRCLEHGVRQVKLPWAEPKARFTLLFERFANEVLQETSIEAATRILGISWDEVWYVLHRAVERGLRRKPKQGISQYGVDEKSAGRGQDQDYVTVICDLERGTVEEITGGSSKESFTGYLDQLSEEQIEGIEAVSMDI